MAADPTFTVIVPAYNAAATIESALRSALAQTHTDFELIVADDESSDDTVAIARTYESDPRVRVLLCSHGGIGSTRNAALAIARGRYISLLDSDDLWMPNYLEVMCETLDQYPEAGFAYTDAWMFDDVSRWFSRSTVMAQANPPNPPPSDPFVFFAEMLRRNFVYVGVTMRRNAVEKVGPFNVDLRTSEDYELWLRMLAHGYQGVRAPGLLGVYRVRPGSVSDNFLAMSKSAIEIYAGLAADARLPARARAALRQRLTEAEREHEQRVHHLTSKRSYLGLRPHLSKLKYGVLRRRRWLPSPPPEVTLAFPDVTLL